MPLESLRQNIEREKQIVSELLELDEKLDSIEAAAVSGRMIDARDKKIIDDAASALLSQMKILNNALPDMINSISFYKKLDESKSGKKPEIKNLLNVKYAPLEKKEEKKSLTIKKTEEKKFLESLSLQSLAARKIKEKASVRKNSEENSRIMLSYIALSNKFFRNTADKLVNSGNFDSLKTDLRKITSPFIINSYIAILLLSTAIGAIAGLFIGIIMFFIAGWIGALVSIIGIPAAVFLLVYFYPSATRKSFEKNINQELPFLTIYMSAVSTSGIEPSKIFNILVMSKDYPATRREIKKLTNYINFYGYDLVNALKLISKSCPSERLAQLFDGMATTITSGGSLTEYLNKHSETLLFDYRLEREKYTHVAETFMNIYISVVIAAPMIMMMLFILMSLTGFGGAFMSPLNIGIITIFAISLLNIGFLVLLNMKQPKF